MFRIGLFWGKKFRHVYERCCYDRLSLKWRLCAGWIWSSHDNVISYTTLFRDQVHYWVVAIGGGGVFAPDATGMVD